MRTTRFARAVICYAPALAALLVLPACRKAAVEASAVAPSVQAGISGGKPAVVVRAPNANADEPWYRELEVVLQEKASDEKDLDAKVEAQKPAVEEAVKKPLDEVEQTVQERRKPNDKW